MQRGQQLDILKMDLQIMHDLHDEYLTKLLELAEDKIKEEGIKLDESLGSSMVAIHYAAYLFRRRASNETSMPRHLRYELNNMLMSQKGKTSDI
ncbi:hypothetical protein MUB35_25815 [Blautia sp. NSJ-175]|uniref:hypothetical protein n=1 Tax=Blautia sp. NSJ-175 TaxID=2931396 RepID=UPI001FD1510F|nr:hypothetical protein [Blautia sp. NSJ-175]MCJ7848742.1 hypothetical protein [Blautia sp. NSJ-175]DAH02930.1 MAG TPA: Head Tail Connector Protein [Caudoviricetes sp.]